MGGKTSKAVETAKAEGGGKLELDGCELTSIPKKIILQFPHLQHLNLSRNSLTTLPSSLATLQRLRWVDVSENQLTTVPECLLEIFALESLSLVENMVTSISPKIENLQALQRLVLQKNQLEELPAEIGKLENLNLLYLGTNQIRRLPGSIGGLRNVTILSVFENCLEELPPEIGQLESMTSLNVSQNRLATLPAEMEQLQDLVELFASSNKISRLPSSLGGGQSGLRTLDLSDNELESVNADLIPNVVGLRNLYLSNNNLTDVPESLDDCSQLELLELDHNRLEVVPTCIFSLLELRELTLNDNAIAQFEEEFVEVAATLERVDISNNSAANQKEKELSPLEEESLLAMLREGGVFLRLPQNSVLTLSVNDRMDKFQWEDASATKKAKKTRTMDLSKVENVTKGIETEVLRKSGHPHKEDFYFSIILRKGATFDFEANSVEERDDWALSFSLLLQRLGEREKMKSNVSKKEAKEASGDKKVKKSRKKSSAILVHEADSQGGEQSEPRVRKRDKVAGKTSFFRKDKKESDGRLDPHRNLASRKTESSKDLTIDMAEVTGVSGHDEARSATARPKSPRGKSPRGRSPLPFRGKGRDDKLSGKDSKRPKKDKKGKKSKESKSAKAALSGEVVATKSMETEEKAKESEMSEKEAKEDVPVFKDDAAAAGGGEEKETKKEATKEPTKEPTKEGSVVPKEDKALPKEETSKSDKSTKVTEEGKAASKASTNQRSVMAGDSEAKLTCPRCGVSCKARAKFCRSCGCKMAAGGTQSQTVATTPAPKPSVTRPVAQSEQSVTSATNGASKRLSIKDRMALFERNQATVAASSVSKEKNPPRKINIYENKRLDTYNETQFDETLSLVDDAKKANQERDKRIASDAEGGQKLLIYGAAAASPAAKGGADKAKAEEEAARKRVEEQEAAPKKAEEEAAAQKAEEEEAARKKAEEEAARMKAEEEEAARKAEEEAAARKKAEEEAARKKAEEEEAARKAEEEAAARKKAEETAAKKRAEEDEAARKESEEVDSGKKEIEDLDEDAARKKVLEEAEATLKRVEEEEAARQKAEEEEAARQKAEEEEAARKKAEEEADRRKAKEDEEALKKAKSPRPKVGFAIAEKEESPRASNGGESGPSESSRRAKVAYEDKENKESNDVKLVVQKPRPGTGPQSKLTDLDGQEVKLLTPTTNIVRSRARPTGRRRPPTRVAAKERLAQQEERKQEEEERRKKRMEEARQKSQALERVKSQKFRENKVKTAAAVMTADEREERREKAKKDFLKRSTSMKKNNFVGKKLTPRGPPMGGVNMAELNSKMKEKKSVGKGLPYKLYQCKGKRRIRVVLVDTKVESLNEGDVFILDMIKVLYVWHGARHTPLKKAKGVEITVRLKNVERKNAKIVNLFSRGDEDDDSEFWQALGGDFSSKKQVKPAEPRGNDIIFEKDLDEKTNLYRVLEMDDNYDDEEDDEGSSGSAIRSGSSGSVIHGGKYFALEEVDGKLIQSMLDKRFAYVLDCPPGEGFAWIGKESPQPMRQAAMTHLREIYSDRPSYCVISRVVSGGESIFFKEKFSNWADNTPMSGGQKKTGFSFGRKKKAKVVAKLDVTKLYQFHPPEENMVDEGQGEVERWMLVGKTLQEETPEFPKNHFWSGESYNILYTWMKGNAFRYIIYYWQGRECHKQDKGQAALLIGDVVKVVKSRNGEPVQERVVEQKETMHFHMIFKERFVVHRGKQPALKDLPLSGTALYHVRGFHGLADTIKAVEVPLDISVFSPQDAYILHTPQEQWVWHGSGSTRECQDRAMKLATEIRTVRRTSHKGEPIVVRQGKELVAFWKALGNTISFAPVSHLKRPVQLRMFYCSSTSGSFAVKEVFNFAQEDLSPESVFIVDAVNEVYVWKGPWAPESDEQEAMKVAVEYVEKAFDGRLQSTPVKKITGGKEPAKFAVLFHAWRGHVSDGDDAVDVGALVKELSRTYTYADLTSGNYPKGLDKTRLESYMNDEEFTKVFDMNKEQFYELPLWIRTQKRQDVGLY